MRYGLALPHYDYSFPDGQGPVTFERMAATAVRAEELGFDSVWISDHFFLSLAKYGGGETLHGSLEPFTALAGLAMRTSRLRLGVMVASAPFRHPSNVAKMAVTLDQLSGGRFELGVGAGWYEDEFAPFGYPFPALGERFSALEDHVGALDALSKGEGFEGETVVIRSDARLLPGPVQEPRVPLWLGAKGGPRALRLAAARMDGWNTAWRWTPETYAAPARAADEACEKIGRDPSSLRRSIGLYLLIGIDEADLAERWKGLQAWTPGGALNDDTLGHYADDTLTGTPNQVRSLIEAYATLGVEEIIVNPASMPFAVYDDAQLDLFAAEVIAKERR